LDQVLVTIGVNFIVVASLTLASARTSQHRNAARLKGNVDLGFREFGIYRIDHGGLRDRYRCLWCLRPHQDWCGFARR
jgi:hypothetical protein